MAKLFKPGTIWKTSALKEGMSRAEYYDEYLTVSERYVIIVRGAKPWDAYNTVGVVECTTSPNTPKRGISIYSDCFELPCTSYVSPIYTFNIPVTRLERFVGVLEDNEFSDIMADVEFFQYIGSVCETIDDVVSVIKHRYRDGTCLSGYIIDWFAALISGDVEISKRLLPTTYMATPLMKSPKPTRMNFNISQESTMWMKSMIHTNTEKPVEDNIGVEEFDQMFTRSDTKEDVQPVSDTVPDNIDDDDDDLEEFTVRTIPLYVPEPEIQEVSPDTSFRVEEKEKADTSREKASEESKETGESTVNPTTADASGKRTGRLDTSFSPKMIQILADMEYFIPTPTIPKSISRRNIDFSSLASAPQMAQFYREGGFSKRTWNRCWEIISTLTSFDIYWILGRIDTVRDDPTKVQKIYRMIAKEKKSSTPTVRDLCKICNQITMLNIDVE